MFQRIKGKIKERKEKYYERQYAQAEELCNHLKQIGLNVTIVRQQKRQILWDWPPKRIMYTIKVANQNVDLIEIATYGRETGGNVEMPLYDLFYVCNYVVSINVDNIEDCLMVELKQKAKGFLHVKLVDVTWEEESLNSKNLAQVLNNDFDLKNYFLSQNMPIGLKIKPYRKHQCVRIIDAIPEHCSPQDAFPTLETFKAYDKIAQHIRSVANKL